jgi:selenide, water dikinase
MPVAKSRALGYQARMDNPIPLTRDLVLIGGGHTHALVLRMWGMSPIPGVRVTLVNPGPTSAYSGMLPGFVAGHYIRNALDIDLVKLARHAGARLILGRATGIDRATRRIKVGDRTIPYDTLSVDIGISSDMPALPGFADHATPAKPLDAFADRWTAFLADLPPDPHVTVIGAGVAGTELALAAAHRLGPSARVTLIEAAEPLAAVGPKTRTTLVGHLTDARITLLTQIEVAEVRADGVVLSDGRIVPSHLTIGTAGTLPQGWLPLTGLALENGFLTVAPTLQTSDPAIFAAGDIAHMAGSPRPKAGVFAVRQAPALFRNLGVSLTGRGTLRSYRPQRDYLKLISTGGKNAVADKWGLPLDGAWLWRWKDCIDRHFMGRLNHLPPMPPIAIPHRIAQGAAEAIGTKPLCGGCGAKVGSATLTRVLATLPPSRRADTLSTPGDDAAILNIGGIRQVITTDHLRSVTEDPFLMARIAAIHALGDIWAMGAQPQAALAQIILPRMSDQMQQDALSEILSAASEIFREAGAEIVGGHTSIGSELTIGFTVTGLPEADPVSLVGARAGDTLLLTKPIGTGIVLAAEMLRAARPEDVIAALASMSHSSGYVAAILAPHARAMTDVTGFGLAGHLLNILSASKVGATLDLRAVPVLAGAETLAAAGHSSTLAASNRSATTTRMTFTESPRAALLFDPQTAGGLLAVVPAELAQNILARLQAAGEPAAIIGTVTAGPSHLTVSD